MVRVESTHGKSATELHEWWSQGHVILPIPRFVLDFLFLCFPLEPALSDTSWAWVPPHFRIIYFILIYLFVFLWLPYSFKDFYIQNIIMQEYALHICPFRIRSFFLIMLQSLCTT